MTNVQEVSNKIRQKSSKYSVLKIAANDLKPLEKNLKAKPSHF